jgi:hypothetical protein
MFFVKFPVFRGFSFCFRDELARQTFAARRTIRRSAQQREDRLWPESEDEGRDGECGDAELADNEMNNARNLLFHLVRRMH